MTCAGGGGLRVYKPGEGDYGRILLRLRRENVVKSLLKCDVMFQQIKASTGTSFRISQKTQSYFCGKLKCMNSGFSKRKNHRWFIQKKEVWKGFPGENFSSDFLRKILVRISSEKKIRFQKIHLSPFLLSLEGIP